MLVDTTDFPLYLRGQLYWPDKNNDDDDGIINTTTNNMKADPQNICLKKLYRTNGQTFGNSGIRHITLTLPSIASGIIREKNTIQIFLTPGALAK